MTCSLGRAAWTCRLASRTLIDEARTLYDTYNFYDSLRFLEAALIG